MAQIIYDESSLVDNQLYKYDKFFHTRINKYTGDGRTPVTYFNINDNTTTMSLGYNTSYQVLGSDSSLRYNKIDDLFLLNFSPVSGNDSNVEGTGVRDIKYNGTAYIIPGTIMPREHDFFIVKHINMNNLFRVIRVTQDNLMDNGYYKIDFELFSTNDQDIHKLYEQITDEYIMDLQTIGGDDLTPIIGKKDYELRSRLIQMVNDMIENYVAQFYDKTHNCFILHANGQSIFDMCGNYFMAKNGVMLIDGSVNNVVLNLNKLNVKDLNILYQKTPYKWIERDSPLRYLQQFRYKLVNVSSYPDSSFVRYGDTSLDVMVPGDAWCNFEGANFYFPMDVVNIFENSTEIRSCKECDCCNCCKCNNCIRHYKLKRFDYISIIHDFIHGKLTSIQNLSLYTGDPLFDLGIPTFELYVWTPIIIYILKHVLKIKE